MTDVEGVAVILAFAVVVGCTAGVIVNSIIKYRLAIRQHDAWAEQAAAEICAASSWAQRHTDQNPGHRVMTWKAGAMCESCGLIVGNRGQRDE